MKYFTIKTNFLPLLACTILLSCGGGSGSDEPDIPDTPETVTPPTFKFWKLNLGMVGKRC